MNNLANIRNLGIVAYNETWEQMQTFTNSRNTDTLDEFWILQHPDTYTLGQAGDPSHIINHSHSIPIIKTDRGGQVTFHGLGQLVIYTLIDIKRLNLSIRNLVELIENSIIDYLSSFGIIANGDRKAPGVYVNDKKIASLGLKVRRGCTYHGLSFNIDMNLNLFKNINVCGYSNLQVTQLKDELLYLGINQQLDVNNVGTKLVSNLINRLYQK